MLQLRKLSVTVRNKKILTDIDFQFEKGKIYAVMGPNGSGKSTLAYSIMGHPLYKVTAKSKIIFGKRNISALSPDKRAGVGIFLSFQSPLSLSGVKVYQLLQLALNGKKDPIAVRSVVKKYAQELNINEDLLSRSLNDGTSGGEKKKLEVLQAAVLDKKLMIFDEVDTGVDIDALKSIARFLNKHKNGKTYILITHYNRILHHLKPDKVLVIIDGKLKKVGDHRLAEKIEKLGYEKVIKN
ncbi:Fe-S cluster assembly ATPase SufC [Candidatus Roizmanbacteria bacterium]|nr:Fe-S cluster assembly ATPase SufC [Candidatus Roizmanbacteria bacterium]